MPIKLTSSDYRVIAVAVVVAGLSLGIGVKYFWRAFPEAAIDFRVNRDDSAPLAEKFLSERGLRLEGYRHAAVFNFDDSAKVYLERTQGLEQMNQLTRGPIRLWRWSHRWFRPQQKEEFRVDIAPAGDVVGFDHEIPEAASGANLDPARARTAAEKFLSEGMKRDLGELEFVDSATEKRPARTDHSFTWKHKSVNLGEGSWRIQVEVDGDQVAGYREFVKIPEQWSRDYERLRSRNISAQLVDEVFWVLLSLAMLVVLVLRLRDRDVPLRLSLGFGLVAAALYFLGQLNDFSVAEFGYRTTDSYSSFMAAYIERSVLSSFGVAAFIFLLVAGSEPIYRESFPGVLALRRTLSWQGLRSRSFFMANVVGIGLTFFFFAYQTVFYLTANKLGAWAPADVNYSDLLNTRIPWVWVLFVGFLPAVSEEMQFRAFAIPFLKKLLGSGPLALVLAAFNWGFLHSAYPNQPFFIRGIEVGLGGIVTGLIMLRFGILATLVWHYSVDALYTAFLLLRSHNHYLMISGGITAGIMLIPLIIALVAYWRTGTFADESALTNASVGITRAPRKEAAIKAETPLAYQPLSQSRLVLAGILTAAFIGLASVPAYRFGKGIKLRVTRPGAVRLADNFLKQRHVEIERFRRVAWLHENVDALAIRYLLELRPVEESDRIYRQATKLVLWEVRYYRPLEKEEHLVFVDPDGGKVFAYRHFLDEDAPGATLSPAEARAVGEKFIEQQGYPLSNFELEESQAEKRKARQDHTLTWQAKSGDPRNIGEAHYRLKVDIAGDQVVGFARFFKVPEDWERRERATRLPNVILLVTSTLFAVGLVGGSLILFVRQVRRGEIRWRASAQVGAVVAAAWALSELNQLSVLDRQYETSISLTAFWLRLGVGLVIVPLLGGLLGWLVVGLATSLYPDAWRVFRSAARRLWRRDAAVAMIVSLAAVAAIARLDDLLASHFHAHAPVRIDLLPDFFDSAWPGAGFFLRGLVSSVFALPHSVFSAPLAALAIYAVRLGVTRRAWWFWMGGLLLFINLGPSEAHSVPEFLLGWAMGFVALAATVGIISAFFRDNVLAYLATAFCLPLADPIVELLSQPAAFFRWNGLLLAGLAAITLGWLLLPGSHVSESAE